MYILSWIVIGALGGWITGRLLTGNQYGPAVDIVMGITGALAGGFLMVYGGLPGRPEIISTTLSAMLGALALTTVVAIVRDGSENY